MLYRFIDVFPNADNLKTRVKDYSSYPNELWEDGNWFLPIDQLFKQIYVIFTAKTIKKRFIWNDEEILPMIEGYFIPLFYEKLLHFYTHQQIFKANELNKISNLDNIGDKLTTVNRGASTIYSQPSESGVDWDDSKDAPSSKRKTLSDINRTNLIKNINTVLNSDISIYWTSFFMDFEKFFISEWWFSRCRGL